MLRLKLALVVLVFGLFASAPAWAVGIGPDEVFTLDAQVPWSITGAAGTLDAYDPVLEGDLNFVADAMCLSGGTVCTDNTNWSGQDWVVFRVTVTSGTLDEVSFSALFELSVANGYFQNLGGTAPTSGDATTNPDAPNFVFSPGLTGQSAPLFVAYPDGLLPSFGGTGSSNFMVRSGAVSDDFMGVVTTVVPEPATLLLLGSGLIGLAAVRRRSRA